MKNSIILFMLLAISFSIYGQTNNYSSEYFLQKSKKQKKAAFITLGTGMASTVAGVVLLNQTEPGWQKVDWGKAIGGSALVIVGAGLLTTSIVLFAAENRNRKKAGTVLLHLNKPIDMVSGFGKKILPYSAGISVSL
jgi:hypothetical protein